MLFLSPGIVYWVPILLHWFDSNAVFIVDIQECVQTLPQKMARNKVKSYTHTAFLIIFRVIHEKRMNALAIGYQH